jgi:hypothetical protein
MTIRITAILKVDIYLCLFTILRNRPNFYGELAKFPLVPCF